MFERENPKDWREIFSRRYLIALGLVAVVCLALSLACFALAQHNSKKAASPRYYLRDTGGFVALYAADGSGPLAEYHVYTRLLPEPDVLALQQGIPIADEAELQQRLEDYGL